MALVQILEVELHLGRMGFWTALCHTNCAKFKPQLHNNCLDSLMFTLASEYITILLYMFYKLHVKIWDFSKIVLSTLEIMRSLIKSNIINKKQKKTKKENLNCALAFKKKKKKNNHFVLPFSTFLLRQTCFIWPKLHCIINHVCRTSLLVDIT